MARTIQAVCCAICLLPVHAAAANEAAMPKCPCQGIRKQVEKRLPVQGGMDRQTAIQSGAVVLARLSKPVESVDPTVLDRAVRNVKKRSRLQEAYAAYWGRA